MATTLGIAWASWKVASKRFGPVVGLVAAGLAVAGYRAFRRRMRDRSAAGRTDSTDEGGRPISL